MLNDSSALPQGCARFARYGDGAIAILVTCRSDTKMSRELEERIVAYVSHFL